MVGFVIGSTLLILVIWAIVAVPFLGIFLFILWVAYLIDKIASTPIRQEWHPKEEARIEIIPDPQTSFIENFIAIIAIFTTVGIITILLNALTAL